MQLQRITEDVTSVRLLCWFVAVRNWRQPQNLKIWVVSLQTAELHARTHHEQTAQECSKEQGAGLQTSMGRAGRSPVPLRTWCTHPTHHRTPRKVRRRCLQGVRARSHPLWGPLLCSTLSWWLFAVWLNSIIQTEGSISINLDSKLKSWLSGATDHHWSVIRSDQCLRFGTHVIRGVIYEKEKLCACSIRTLVTCSVVTASRGTEELERPASFKWEHFGFPVKYNDEGKRLVDKTVTVCRHCGTRKPYDSGNTSSMATHLKRHHPGVSDPIRDSSRDTPD